MEKKSLFKEIARLSTSCGFRAPFLRSISSYKDNAGDGGGKIWDGEKHYYLPKDLYRKPETRSDRSRRLLSHG
jgi:hypothetical protein